MIIYCATTTEAKPIIETLGLKREHGGPFTLFKGNHTLIIGGIGKCKAAASLSHLLTLSPEPVLNVGLAAGEEIGQLYHIRKVIDADTHQVYHLPPLDALPNESCTTHSRPATTPHKGLADMEASALVCTARLYRQPIAILKVVSDHFDPKSVERSSHLIAQNLPKILSLL